jgi:hypothetical protein
MKLKNLHKTSIARVRSTEDATIQKLVPLNLQLPKLNQTNPFDSCETTLSYQTRKCDLISESKLLISPFFFLFDHES